MAQAITNTVKSTNPLAGLLGLIPKPKAQPSPVTTSPFGLSTPHAPNMSTPSGPAYAAPPTTGLVSTAPKPATPLTPAAPIAQAPVQKASPAPVLSPIQPAAVTQPAAASSAPAVKGLFPDVLSSLAYTAPSNNAALGANAQKIAADYGAKIADVGKQGAAFRAGQLTTGTTPVAEGNAAVTAQTTAAEQSALAAGESAALTGNQQAISAQGQTQSGLSAAGSLAAPQVTAFGQTSFSPATGEFAGGGSLPADVMQQYATMAANGQYSAIPSFITSNPVLNAQLNVAAKALNPSFTPVGAQGASGVLQGIPALQSANTAADGIKNTITSYLAANPQLNPSDLAAGNVLQQWIQGKQLTDPKYQTLFNYLDEYTNTLAPILGVGGDPTNLKTQIAQGFINSAASGQSISQVLQAMSTLATNKIQDLQSGATGGGTSVPASGAGNDQGWGWQP